MKKLKKAKRSVALALAMLMMVGTVNLPANLSTVYAEEAAVTATTEAAEAATTAETAAGTASTEAGTAGTEAAATGSTAEAAEEASTAAGTEESAAGAGTESGEAAEDATSSDAGELAATESETSEEEGTLEDGEVLEDVLIHRQEEIHIRVGEEFHFYDDLAEDEEEDSDDWVSYVTGPEEDGKEYRAAIKSVETPEGGSYTFDENDYEVEEETFTPQADDAGLTYKITWKAQVSTDHGDTWNDVDADNEDEESYKTKLIVDEVASPSEAATEEVGTVTFTGEEEMTAYVGEEFLFTDESVISVTGPDDHGETYRPVVVGIETPEGGSYTYQDGDESFTPAEEDAGLVYDITYHAEKKEGEEASWEEVPDAEFSMLVTVADKEDEEADTVSFVGEEEMTAFTEEEFLFTDESVISVTGPDDHGETYRPVVESIRTPEGGSYTYADGDESFTPAEEDIGLVYDITYHAEEKAGEEASWEEVPDAEFVMHVTVDKKHTRRRRSLPIYAGLISDLTLEMADEFYTGSFADASVHVGINGSASVDEPFYLQIVFPKDGVYGPDATVGAYRLHASDLAQSLETTLTEDADNYIVQYKLQPTTSANIFSLPVSFKFLRDGSAENGTTYTVTLRIVDLNDHVIKSTEETATLKTAAPPSGLILGYPNRAWADGIGYHNRLSNYGVRSFLPNDPAVNDGQTGLKDDPSAVPAIRLGTSIKYPGAPRDSQRDIVGIRKISRIIDTYTLPDIAYVDASALPEGCTYNPANHTITRTFENSMNWWIGSEVDPKASLDEDCISIKLPGAVKDQVYTVKSSRRYEFDSSPADNFTLNSNEITIKYSISTFSYDDYFETRTSQSGHYGATAFNHFFDNLIEWNSDPYAQTSLYRYFHTNDTNPPVAEHTAPVSIEGLKVSNDEIDENLQYKSVILNPNSVAKPTEFSGTFRLEGIRADGSTTVIANNISYPVGFSLEIPVTGDFQKVQLVANAGATMASEYQSQNLRSKQGCDVRFVFKFKDGLDSHDSYIFKGRMSILPPEERGPMFQEFYHMDGQRGYQDWYTGDPNRIYKYAFHYHPEEEKENYITASPITVDSTADQNASRIGDEFTLHVNFREDEVKNDADQENGKLTFILPIGYELVEGSETLETGSHGTFEKSSAEILSSREGHTGSGYHGQAVYTYDVGNVSGLSVGDLLSFSAKIRHKTYHPGVYSDYRLAEAVLRFNQNLAKCKETEADRSEYQISYSSVHYVVASEFKPVTKGISTDHHLISSKEGLSDPFIDAVNEVTIASQRLAFSGFDYYNDLIDVEVQIKNNAGFDAQYSGGAKLKLELPSGLDIVSETLTDNNGNFISDKTLPQIVASRTNGTYDFGNTQAISGKPWDLTLKLKVKVTEAMLPGSSHFTSGMTLIDDTDTEYKAREMLVGDFYRAFNYLPSSGFTSVLTGNSGVTAKEMTDGKANSTKYEITLANYTGSVAKNISVIDILPNVGDTAGNGDPRNSELNTEFKFGRLTNLASGFTAYYSDEVPLPGMSVAEYDGVATWVNDSYQLHGPVKAIKLVSSTGIPVNTTQKIADLYLDFPNDELKAENSGKVINNSISAKYQAGSLVANYTDSNVKQYEYKCVEPEKPIKVNYHVFYDLNRNNVYDEGDVMDPAFYSSLARVYKEDGTNVTNLSFGSAGSYTPATLHEAGRYYIGLNLPALASDRLKLCTYGPGDNESNIHEATGKSEIFELNPDDASEVTVNIGLQYTGYDLKYDFNGGTYSDDQTTYKIEHYQAGEDVHILHDDGQNRYHYPYHYYTSVVWNTEPDGSGTSYTPDQLISGGFPLSEGETKTLYLQWTEAPSNITVRYHANYLDDYITGTMADDTATVGTPYTVKHNAFTNSAGTFAGWSTTADMSGGTIYYEGQEVPEIWDGHVTEWAWGGPLRPMPVVIDLYAVWRQDLYAFKTSDKYGYWEVAVENPDHPITDPYDPTKNHPYNFAAHDPVAGARFRITKINDDGSEGDLVSSAVSREHGELYFHEVIPGTYYLIEESTPEGYEKTPGKWKITVQVDPFTGDNVISSGEPVDPATPQLQQYAYYMKSHNMAIVNNKVYYHEVSLSTQVDTSAGIQFSSVDRDFNYRIRVLDKNFQPIANQTYEYTGGTIAVADGHAAPEDGSFTTDENGLAYVTLKHGQKIEIHDMPGKARVSFTMLGEGGDVFTQVDGGGFTFTPSRVVGIQLGAADNNSVSVDFRNANFIPVPAGIADLNSKPFLFGSGAAAFLALGAFLIHRKRRRKQRKDAA
jgi:hypothetical protein